MFQFLRRSKQKNAKRQTNDALNQHTENRQHNITKITTTPPTKPLRKTPGVRAERYRQFSDHERSAAGPPLGGATNRGGGGGIRATIEELEDSHDLVDDEDGKQKTKTAASASSSSSSTSSRTHEGRNGEIYFERCSEQRPRRRREEEEKVNLAKAAANFTPLVTAPIATTTTTTAPPTTATTAATTTTTNIARNENSNSNSATTKPNTCASTSTSGQAHALSKSDVDRIYKIVAATSSGSISSYNNNNNNISTFLARNAADDGSNDGVCVVEAHSESSQNEDAEWQGHVSPNIGTERKIIDKSIKRHVPLQQFNSSDQAATIAKDAERSVAASTAATTRGNNGNRNSNNSGDCNSNSNTGTGTGTATADTVINEVKYRNLGNSETSVRKKNSAAKRQSRLSLTLGLNLYPGKNKSVNTTTTPPQQNDDNSGTKSVAVKQRKSFFQLNHSKTKSSNKQSEEIETGAAEAKSVEVERKLRPLQKSREFFSDIVFMARGRNNHNRNRNQQQQQQQQHPQQQQQQQQHQQPQQPEQPQKPEPPQEPEENSSSQLLPQPQSAAETGKYAAAATVSSPPAASPSTAATAVILTDHNNHNNNNNNRSDTTNTMNSAHNEDNNNGTNCSTLYSANTHLETISDPSDGSTNSYQMTTSNNSTKNFSQVAAEAEQPHRSNSAESASAEFGESRPTSPAHALSTDPTKGASTPAAGETEAGVGEGAKRSVEEAVQSNVVGVLLNDIGSDDEQSFIHATNIERNGVKSVDADKNRVNICEPHDQEHRDQQPPPQQRQQQQQEHANQIKTSARETIIAHAIRASGAGSADTDANTNSTTVGNATRQLNELTECDRDSWLHGAASREVTTGQHSDGPAMGQTNAKPSEATPPSTRNSETREFRESLVREKSPLVNVPIITVEDYSDKIGTGAGSGSSGIGSPVEKEVFYDFDDVQFERSYDKGLSISVVDEDSEKLDGDDDGIEVDRACDTQIPMTVHATKWSPQMRHSYAKLENVPEQEEEYEQENEHQRERENERERNLDSELFHSHSFDSPERNALKSANTSDSNLSTGFPDSGIGDSQASATPRMPSVDTESALPTRPLQQQQHQQQQRVPFVRDGYSTDCEETLMQCDDFDFVVDAEANAIGGGVGGHGNGNPNERLVCIESISLPDVVVESTTGTSGANNASASAAAAANEQINININGASGNNMGNVHFIPIHVEGDSNAGGNASGSSSFNKIKSHSFSNFSQKRRSVDDSVIGSGGKNSFTLMNGHLPNTTIEIIEDDSETDQMNKLHGYKVDNTAEKLKCELIEQKSHFKIQLEDAHKNVHNLQTKVFEMQTKIEKLEQELSTKAWNVERLQGELLAAHKDDEYVRKKLKLLENEKTNLRHRYSENEEEFKKKYEELEAEYQELADKYQQTRHLASNLQTQLALAQSEAEDWRLQVEAIRTELEDQIRILKNALENSEAELKICQDKWQKEFEMLRTQNLDREESLMTDCEWQLRHMQKQCKDKMEKSDHQRKTALEQAELLETELEERTQQVDNLKVFQAEATSLRGVVTEQEHSIQTLMRQIENLKADLEAANENLEEQIEAVKKIKYQCDNALCDKERHMIYRIDEVRNEAALFWEDKLYTEMTRLKTELESVYVDERREALDKLQAEHIEELRALTTRYTANEEELRTELAELQERVDRKSDEFLELREKSDNALLQTRMHLDRADREYQNAMCREEERREELEESLRKEFEVEKEDMEERFRERLGHVKEEFAKELQISTQETAAAYIKELEQQKHRFQAEKDEAMQDLSERHRKKLAAAEEQMKDIELRQHRDLQDLKATYDTEKIVLDKRDISNANEIEQLHRKCRCLTNLFEEMRMRYERRDPRPEDLREIAELRSRCESQEHDLYLLTDRLRDMQIQMSALQRNAENTTTNNNNNSKKGGKQLKKPPPKTIATSCDVIYEENEERDSPPPPPATATQQNHSSDAGQSDGEEAEDEEDADLEESVKELNGKNLDMINEDDSHMITAM